MNTPGKHDYIKSITLPVPRSFILPSPIPVETNTPGLVKEVLERNFFFAQFDGLDF